MPKLWAETIESHRREVRDAVLDATAALVAGRGLRAVTMSQIAEDSGIGRATLYKYFPDVEAILLAWHERLIAVHLEGLIELRDQAPNPGAALADVLRAYAHISHAAAQETPGSDLVALLHRGPHVARAHQQLRRFIRDLLAQGAVSGDVRADVTPDELAAYCLHALSAAGGLPSKAAVHRLTTVTLAGLRPDRGSG